MFHVRGEFEVRPGCTEECETVDGPAGAWVQSFQSGTGYLGTDLTQITRTRWATVDRWTSRARSAAFRVAPAAADAELDASCAELTTAERPLDESGE